MFNIFLKIVLISISILVKRLVSQSTCSTNSTKGAQEFEPKPLGLNTINQEAPQHWLQPKPYQHCGMIQLIYIHKRINLEEDMGNGLGTCKKIVLNLR